MPGRIMGRRTTVPVRVVKNRGRNSKGEATAYALMERGGKIVARAKTKREAEAAARARNAATENR